MKYLNDEYQDRGMKKWAGFFLSEHTAEQEKIQKGLAHINSPKAPNVRTRDWRGASSG